MHIITIEITYTINAARPDKRYRGTKINSSHHEYFNQKIISERKE
jgi:hypothetical protein